MEMCLVEKGSLAMLGNCKQLKTLQLVRTKLLAGAGESLAVLAHDSCPELELILDEVVDAQPAEGSTPLHFLACLAPRLARLDITTATKPELHAVLGVLGQQQFPHLHSLKLSVEAEDYRVDIPVQTQVIQQLAASCPQLSVLHCHQVALPNMQCLRELLATSQFKQLKVRKLQAEEDHGVAAALPPGRCQLQLSFQLLSPTQMSALPFEHCSKVDIFCLLLPRGQTRQQQSDAMQTALQHAARCSDVRLGWVVAVPGRGEAPAPGGGLSALTAGCAVQPQNQSILLHCLALEPADLRGLAAALGSSLKYLKLEKCILSPEAWVTLASSSTSLPALSTLRLREMEEPQLLMAQVLALCLAWPRERRLEVQLVGEGPKAWLSQCADMLRAHGRLNIQLISSSD
jgi:hypothetical protein